VRAIDSVSATTIQAIAPAAIANGDNRNRDGRRARAVEQTDLHRQRVEKMRQRQPHGADSAATRA